MNKLVFVFASNIRNVNYRQMIQEYINEVDFTTSFDILFLCSSEKEKILKKDVDLDLKVLTQYETVCPVGAEALKYVCNMTGITKYNGMHIEKRYVPIIHPSMTVYKPQYKDELLKAFKLIKDITAGTVSVVRNDKVYKYIADNEEFMTWFTNDFMPAPLAVCDIETTSLSYFKGNIIGVAFAVKPHHSVFINIEVIKKNNEEIKKAVKNKKIILHNAKFDIGFLSYELGWEFPDFEDTMLLHYCLEESVGTHGLKQLALRFTDLGDYEKELDEFRKKFCRANKILVGDFNYGMFPIDVLAPYACRDGDATYQLYHKFKPIVQNNPKFKSLYENILIPASRGLTYMERNGGPIDFPRLAALEEDYTIDIEQCLEEISRHEGVQRFERIHGKSFNPNSTQQLRELFFNILQLDPVKKTDTGAWSTDKEVLGELNHPLADCILDLRQKTKMISTYVSSIREGLDPDGRLRSGFNIHGTTSGRLSSSGNLNYQNIPRDNKDIKKLFRARPGYVIVQGDLKTAEVYYAAVLAKDKFLQKAFIDRVDFHSYIAKQIFNLPCKVEEIKKLYPDHRQWAKAITFGIMYQAGPKKIAETANVSHEEAKLFIKKYFNEASALKTFIDNANSQIEIHAYIYSFFGRKRRLPESRSPNRGVAGHAIRSGVNFLVQSVASDINLLALIELVEWIKANGYDNEIIPFTIVHDSIVAEVKLELVDTWLAISREITQRDRGISIPNCPIEVDFEIGPSWGDLKPGKEWLSSRNLTSPLAA